MYSRNCYVETICGAAYKNNKQKLLKWLLLNGFEWGDWYYNPTYDEDWEFVKWIHQQGKKADAKIINIILTHIFPSDINSIQKYSNI